MPYDPKRPRRTLDDEAPVEALLTGEVPVVASAAPEPEAGPAAEPDESGSSGAVNEVTNPPVERRARPAERPPAASPAPSSVPVAPAPDEQTANLAVAGATGAAAIITLIVLLLLRRRSRRHRSS